MDSMVQWLLATCGTNLVSETQQQHLDIGLRRLMRGWQTAALLVTLVITFACLLESWQCCGFRRSKIWFTFLIVFVGQYLKHEVAPVGLYHPVELARLQITENYCVYICVCVIHALNISCAPFWGNNRGGASPLSNLSSPSTLCNTWFIMIQYDWIWLVWLQQPWIIEFIWGNAHVVDALRPEKLPTEGRALRPMGSYEESPSAGGWPHWICATEGSAGKTYICCKLF